MVLISSSLGYMKKKQPACKPGSVPRLAAKCLPFIYACCHQQALAVYPPTWGRATLIMSVYMTLQLLRRTALVSPQDRWALTPPSHPYHNPGRHGGYFLLRYSTLADSFLLGSRMLCVARTFLFYHYNNVPATDRPTAFFVQRYANKRNLCYNCQDSFDSGVSGSCQN